MTGITPLGWVVDSIALLIDIGIVLWFRYIVRKIKQGGE
jgi:hypothetical protein